MLSQIDIEDLVQKCRSKNAQAYVREAADCYRIGAYRACVITTWIALVYDFVDKLRELAIAGDPAAIKRVVDFDEIQKNRDTEKALKFEKEVLLVAKDEFELIGAQEMADLGRLMEDRNRCGHPNINKDYEVYSPPPELARLHLRLAIEHVLSRPPVQGKAAVSYLQQVVDFEQFPVNVNAAKEILKGTPLAHAKRSLIQDFVRGCVLSIIREGLSERKRDQRLAAFQAAHQIHSQVVDGLMSNEFDGLLFKSKDDCHPRILWVLSRSSYFCTNVKAATWSKLEAYVRATPSPDISSLFHSLMIDRLAGVAIERVSSCTENELIALVRQIDSQNKPIIDACVAMYAASASWDSAKSRGRLLIEPVLKYATPAQAEAVICAGMNSEVRDCFQFPGIAWEVKQSGRLTATQMNEVIVRANLQDKLSHLMSV